MSVSSSSRKGRPSTDLCGAEKAEKSCARGPEGAGARASGGPGLGRAGRGGQAKGEVSRVLL